MLEERAISVDERQAAILDSTEQFVKKTLEKDSTGHDWWHILRVRNNARSIASQEPEPGDLFVIELAALLHDVADWKFHGGDTAAGAKVSAKWLRQQNVSEPIIEHVGDIVENISYKGAGVKSTMATIEGMIVQDADRLDALGAIGIARAFAYGAHAGRPLYDPGVAPTLHDTFEQYKNSKGHTINHFYEKLLLVKDRMNTPSAKRIAESRHQFMEQYLEQFYREWAGNDGIR